MKHAHSTDIALHREGRVPGDFLLQPCHWRSGPTRSGPTRRPAPPLPQTSSNASPNFSTMRLRPGSCRAPHVIQQHGKPVYLKCFGVQDIATKIAMTSDTIFALHSMTKPITSVAAMMLIDAGKLSLADPVSKFIPGFSDAKVGVSSDTPDGQNVLKLVPADRPVTIMDLLRHTSGIRYEYIGGKLIMKAYSESGLFDERFDNKVFADRIARLPLARQPGTLWRHGHSTDVLGRIIEIVSGQTLYQFEKQHIFDPLGMTSTKFVLESADERARMAEPLPSDTILKLAETSTSRPPGMGVRRWRIGFVPDRLRPFCSDDPGRRAIRRQTLP